MYCGFVQVESHVEALAKANLKLQADNSALCREMQLSRVRQRQLQGKMRKLLMVLLNLFHKTGNAPKAILPPSAQPQLAIPATAAADSPAFTVTEPTDDTLRYLTAQSLNNTYNVTEPRHHNVRIGHVETVLGTQPLATATTAPDFSVVASSAPATGTVPSSTAAPAVSVVTPSTSMTESEAVELKRAMGEGMSDIPELMDGNKLTEQINKALQLLGKDEDPLAPPTTSSSSLLESTDVV